MSAKNHTAPASYVHPEDPAGHLKPDQPLIVDGLDWSWAFVVYREVKNFPGYRVGTNGVVWSRLKSGWVSSRYGAWRRLALLPRIGGYVMVHLFFEGKDTYRLVHYVVLEAFVGLRPDRMEACHFPDRNPRNNRVENLRWDTALANAADAVAHGTKARGSRVGRSKLTESDIPIIRQLHAQGTPYVKIAARYGVTHGIIGDVVRRDSWKHVP